MSTHAPGDATPVDGVGDLPRPSTSVDEIPTRASAPLDENVAADPTRPHVIGIGNAVVLMGADGKKLLARALPGKRRGTHYGEVELGELVGRSFGDIVRTMKGQPFHLLRPTIEDHVMGLKRATQIIYPKDIGPILMKLGLFSGARVFECGSGSGGLTIALASMVGPTGKVVSFDRAPAHQLRCAANLRQAGLDDRVELRVRDVTVEGFGDTGADALFLDLKEIAEAIPHAAEALHPGCVLGAIVPTFNQVVEALNALDTGLWADIDVMETLYRRYKTNAPRLRPFDRMVGHTGFLVFARRVNPLPVDPDLTPVVPPETDGPDDLDTDPPLDGDDA